MKPIKDPFPLSPEQSKLLAQALSAVANGMSRIIDKAVAAIESEKSRTSERDQK